MSSDLGNLARHVLARYKALDMTQIDVWQAGGPSNSTLTAIQAEAGEPSAATLRKLDKALQWERGSARTALNGGTPVPLKTPAPVVPLASVSDIELLAEVGRRLGLTIKERETDGRKSTTTKPPGSGRAEQGRIKVVGRVKHVRLTPRTGAARRSGSESPGQNQP